jgi:hypothetical protein
MLDYTDTTAHPELNSSPITDRAAANIDRKKRRSRTKSPYRDGLMRVWFQAFNTYESYEGKSGTSVTFITPAHPFASIIKIEIPKPFIKVGRASKSSAAIPYISEDHSIDELLREARFWQAYQQESPHLGRHYSPAPWRDLSDIGRLEWFHHALRLTGPWADFSLNLSDEIETKLRAAPHSAKWIAARIRRQLKLALGRSVDCWFVLELSDKRRLHLHGEIAVAEADFVSVRKALRLAGGEWEHTRQHQTKLRSSPTSIWVNYCLKQISEMRKRSGRLGEIQSRPIQGSWFFATNNVRAAAKSLYEDRRACAIQLKNSGLLQIHPDMRSNPERIQSST